ncbi:SymE family type I addiction module toxin [Paraburkholderia sacchari]|uniref:Type I toxin-antitoxin system SymE family toxin n=1 Tax=Paraburkholderia sacchari TaxID=159450 RepID=A0A8T6ZKM9_9BURK|nr:SymE family type I addiction module toxin [Paraburkholderia sacchari]NLP65767.1 type I toxin-antitoxin system SymE family toxin [Paraburkholderia sacchari]
MESRLSGRWLELAGFEAGQQVRIEVEHSRLVIMPD